MAPDGAINVSTSLKTTWKKLAELHALHGTSLKLTASDLFKTAWGACAHAASGSASRNTDNVNRMVFLVKQKWDEERRRATAEGGMKPH